MALRTGSVAVLELFHQGLPRAPIMFSTVFSIIVYSLSLVLLVVLFGRNVARRLVFLTLFISLCILRDTVSLFLVHTSFAHHAAWFYIYWTSEVILSAMYLGMIAEISRQFLSDYPSIRRPALRVLGAVALALISWTVFSAMRHAGHPVLFFMTGEQRLVLTITMVLLLLMGIVAYYRLRLPPLYRLVLIGIGIYASLEVVADQVMLKYRLGPDSICDYTRRGAFAISVVVWTYAVWRWGAASIPRRELISQSKYDDISPQLHESLHEANLKLANLTSQRS
jgi:hypothetical protein